MTCWSKHRANNTTRRLHSSSNGWIEAYSIWCHSQTFHLFQGFLYTWLWKTGQKDGRSWDDSGHGFMDPFTSLQHHPRKLERRWVRCTFPGFRWKVVCHEVWANEKNFTKPGCSPDIMGIFPLPKEPGIFPWLFTTIRMWLVTLQGTRHRLVECPTAASSESGPGEQVGRTWVLDFVQLNFLFEIPPKVVSVCWFPQPNLFPSQKP